MKKLIILFFVFLKHDVFSQDTLRLKNGTLKAVKVIEISSNEVKYKRFDNPDGPFYVNNKNEIAYVKYANGQIDVFNEVSDSVTVQPNISLQTAIVSPFSVNDKIEIGKKKLYYNGSLLGELRMSRLINSCTNEEKRGKLQKSFSEMKSYKKKQYSFGFGFLGAAVGCLFIGEEWTISSAISGYDNPTPLLIGAVCGVTFGITGAILSSVFKKKRIEKFRATALIYNE